MSLVELGTYWDRFEAEIVRGRLQSEGVEAVLFDTGLVAAYGNAFPVRLMVLDEDSLAARAILAEDAAD
jgi:hypothetical protein